MHTNVHVGRTRRLPEPRGQLMLHDCGPADPGRDALEYFIRTVFLRSYGADVRSFYPQLIGIRGSSSELVAVTGLRPASPGPLFCEHYLDRPVEKLPGPLGGAHRESIVEVGNLAPAGAGQARWLIATLTAYLHGAGFDWCVFTAVPALYNAFRRMGLTPLPLAAADAASLPAHEQGCWGSYFAGQPLVCACPVEECFATLDLLIDPASPQLQALWRDAQVLGAEFGVRLQSRPVAAALN